jgi:uncharacterized protein YkwD
MALGFRTLLIIAVLGGIAAGGVPTPVMAQEKPASDLHQLSTAELRERIQQANDQLDEQIKKCIPIDTTIYRELLWEARRRRSDFVIDSDPTKPQPKFREINDQYEFAKALNKKAEDARGRQWMNEYMSKQYCRPPAKSTTPPDQAETQTQKPPAQGSPGAKVPEQAQTQTAKPPEPTGKPPQQTQTPPPKSPEQKSTKTNQPAQAGGQAPSDKPAPKTDHTESLEPPPLKFGPQPKTPPQSTNQSSLPLPVPKFAEPILAVHNAERLEFGAPPLQWDPQLATAAAAYAQQLADGAPYVHSPRTGREDQRENLSRGLRGARPEQMMRIWTNEKRYFHAGVFPDVSTTGDANDVLHYTQMIWRMTTRLGCGVANGKAGAFMVCRYSPPGNAPGKAIP